MPHPPCPVFRSVSPSSFLHMINKKETQMFPIETISAKMLDYYADRSDALIIDVRDAALYQKKSYPRR